MPGQEHPGVQSSVVYVKNELHDVVNERGRQHCGVDAREQPVNHGLTRYHGSTDMTSSKPSGPPTSAPRSCPVLTTSSISFTASQYAARRARSAA